MIFEERTIYLYHTVKAGGKELYQGFDVSDAWRAMLEATNDQEAVEMMVRRMDSNEAKKQFKKQRCELISSSLSEENRQ